MTPRPRFAAALLGVCIGTACAQAPPPRAPPRFPPASVWNQDVSALPADADSAAMIASSVAWGGDAAGSTRFQIDFSMHVLYRSWGGAVDTPLVEESDYYVPDCDTGERVPLPAVGAIEGSTDYTCDYGGEDCHLLVAAGDDLYESYHSSVDGDGLHSQCLVRWRLNFVYPPAGRGDGCTSADAAGFPIAPLIFGPDEVHAAMQSGGTLGHALRFILHNDRIRAGVYVHPASHVGAPSGPTGAIPYGARLRLKPTFDTRGYGAAARVILDTLKRYGMFLADGGSIPLSADDGLFQTHHWDDADLALDSYSLFGVRLDDFDVMPIGTPVPIDDCARNGAGDDVVFADGLDR
ncbi:MAG TPA: hypothetical protein VGC30_02700 [Dokdonella sp.]